MKKKIISLLLALAVCLSLCAGAFAAENSYANFGPKRTYENQFEDVAETAWYAGVVQLGYEYGFINGMSETEFAPDKNLSIAEAITLATRIHSIYTTGDDPELNQEEGGAWYAPYVRYALEKGIIASEYNNYNTPAVRSEVAQIFAKALPAEALTAVRTVEDNAIPDVPSSASYAEAVYLLYRAGVLSGNDEYGTFMPNSNIKRSEIAAICVRMAVPGERSAKALASKPAGRQKLSATQISEKCSSAVFYIDIYGMSGAVTGSGSGFFISEDGLAITNYHVAANSSCLTATTTDGTVYSSIAVLDYDYLNDLVLLRVNGVSGANYITLGDSSTVKQGETVYAIGSPLGLSNTMSVGIVSNASRVLDGITYIQTSAQITHGSSGGALVNEYGEAVGVTCAAFESYGDLNLAVPINYAKALDTASQADLYVWDDYAYYGFEYAVDFGEFAGLYYVDTESVDWGIGYIYDMGGFADSPAYSKSSNQWYTMYYYEQRLFNYGFELVEDGEYTVYENGLERVTIYNDYSSYRIIVVIQWIPQYYERYPDVLDFGWIMEIPLTNIQTRGSGTTYWYDYSDYYSYSEMSNVALDYAYIIEDDGYYYTDSGDYSGNPYWYCEGNGLSVLIMQYASRVTIYISAL